MQNNNLTPKEAFTWLTKVMPGCRNPDLEKTIATDALHAFCYARDVIKGRFELGEPVIAQDHKWAYMYAAYVLEGRFELGEPIIAKNAQYAYYYAHDVLKGRFQLGEPIILKSIWADEYKEQFNMQ